MQDCDHFEKQLKESIILYMIQEFIDLYRNENKQIFEQLNIKYLSSGKPEHTGRRLIFIKLFQKCHDALRIS